MRRKVFFFVTADMSSLKSDMKDFQHAFLNSNPLSRSVQDNWTMFTDNVKKAMDDNIPSKLSSSSHKSPWITREVRRMSKKKQRLYNKAKKSQTEQDWRAYKDFQKATQKKEAAELLVVSKQPV